MMDRAWIEVSHKALLNNLHQIEKSIGRSKVMAVVKDQTYGMGLDAAFALQEAGVDFFAVAEIGEAIELRKIGIEQPILIFGYTHPDRFGELLDYDFIQTVISVEFMEVLNEYGTHHQPINCHIKVNTGMNRLGIRHDDLPNLIRAYDLPGLKVTGIYSHLLSADQPATGHAKSLEQLTHFDKVLSELEAKDIQVGLTHMLNSAGIVYFGESHQYDYVRPGLHLVNANFEGYQNALSVLARVAAIKAVKAHENVGYGIENVLEKDSKIATITIGYGDGIPRELGKEHFRVLINGTYCPIVGRICMDQLLVDVTTLENINQGDLVKIIHDGCTVDDVAQMLDTIPNEILTQFSCRLTRNLIYEENEIV